jgi:Flp pilus assembly pilin Flp
MIPTSSAQSKGSDMTTHLTITGRWAAARLQLCAADIAQRIDDVGQRRLGVWRDDGERGAQAAEYAMLGGVSAAACTGLVAIFKNRATLRTLVEAILTTLGKVIEGWF